MENLEMDDMKEITKEMAIKAAAAAMANYKSLKGDELNVRNYTRCR